MKICSISDTHNQLSKIIFPYDFDILIIAGDFTINGSMVEILKFNKDLQNVIKKYRFKNVVYIAGNHEKLFETDPSLAKSLVQNAYYLQHESIRIGNVNIFGSAYTPTYCNLSFNIDRGAPIREKWDLIPIGTDIIVTHGPPYKILDNDREGAAAGCADLLDVILRIKPKIHIFGHLHSGYGEKFFNDIHFVNAASCDEEYRPVNQPIEIEI